jgi:adenylate cyclase
LQAQGIFTALAGSLITAVMLLLYILQPSLATRLDLNVYDLLLPLRAASAPSPVPVIIDLDEASLEAYGQWPWPRHLVADLLEALQQYEVAAIGLDIMFAEADRSSPEWVRQDLAARDKAFDLDLSAIPQNFRDYDQLLAAALRESPAVLGAYANFSGAGAHEEQAGLPLPVRVIERALPGAIPWLPLVPQAGNLVLPLPVLRDKAPLGFINVIPDLDGVVRKLPVLIRTGETVHPSLALRTLMRGMGVNNLTVTAGPDGLEAIRVGEYAVSVSPQGLLHIPFIGPRKSYPYFSAADVLRGKVAPEELSGRVAFVGTSTPGLADIRATPLDPACPGVEIHAAVLDAVLTGNALSLPPWTPALQIFGILLSGCLSTLAFGFARPRVYLPAAAALMLATVLISRHLFAGGLFVSPLYCILTIAMIGAFLLLTRFWQEERQKLMLRATFARYVSPEVVRRITRSQGDVMAGEERELSIMFTDIRGFTSLAETLKPREVVALLSRYFTPMTALVRKNGGTLDKFIGDAMMAYWNAPLDVPDHPLKAISSALSMQDSLPGLNEKLRPELGLEIHIGIGVHTGPAFVGNMGSEDLVNYTLIGDNVNLASRMEGLCAQYGVGIVVSGESRAGCGNAFAFQHLDTLRVKGKTKAVTIYQPLRHAEAQARAGELATWEAARMHYAAGDFAEADRILAGLCEEFPETQLYFVFAERTARLLKNPPSFWNGVWILTSK